MFTMTDFKRLNNCVCVSLSYILDWRLCPCKINPPIFKASEKKKTTCSSFIF